MVELVTPCDGGQPVVTVLASSNSSATAIQYATETGLSIQRPVRLPRGTP